ncbi:MAG TPA: enoyl-CoA hydratase/isomerase family protein [Vineibacter sp.]|nr:enoyl-CoA hydratase/isomerase family protein [Vineibacter sp.]
MSGFPSYDTILLARTADVARLTFNRPQRRNALTHAMMLEIGDAIVRVRADPSIRILVLRGSGGAFCAGGDIGAMSELPPPPADGRVDPLTAPYRVFGDVLLALNDLPIPVISIVEGPAVGGGFGMACCSDVVILLQSAKFGIPEPRSGFIPSQVLPFIARRIGEGPLRELAVTGRVINAQEAFALGIGRHVCDTHDQANAILHVAIADIRRNSPAALAAVKRLVLACAVKSDAEVLDDAATELVMLLRRPDTQAGMKAFLNKQTPPWAEADAPATAGRDP